MTLRRYKGTRDVHIFEEFLVHAEASGAKD
jgi:hypothetical protein